MNFGRSPRSSVPWLTRSSRGEKRESSFCSFAVSSAAFLAESRVACVSPVEISAKQTPARFSRTQSAQMKLLRDSSSMLLSSTVPGVITRMMLRLTSPFASLGSSICSQMATLWPLAISFAT